MLRESQKLCSNRFSNITALSDYDWTKKDYTMSPVLTVLCNIATDNIVREAETTMQKFSVASLRLLTSFVNGIKILSNSTIALKDNKYLKTLQKKLKYVEFS